MAVLIALGGAACATRSAMRAVERGDLAALRADIGVREKAGRISNRDAACLARAVAERDLRAAFGPDAVERVRDARSCAHELDGALAARMATHDAAGAEAALARIESGGLDLDDVRVFVADAQPAWRAVATRALVRPADRDARIHALVDPDPQVRRQAARAAREAGNAGDLIPLVEVARVDPQPIVRTEAVRAIANLRATPNGGAIVDALRDVWTLGDDALREDIVLAWSSPTLWGTGGREALRVVVAADHGHAAIEAAAAVLRHRDADDDVAQLAVAQLVRAIEGGSRASRLHALAQSPLDRRELFDSVQAVTGDDDVQVRVAALARLAETRSARVKDDLVLLSGTGSPVAGRARFALAASGDRRVQAWVEQDLAADQPEVRLAAGTELAAMGVAARGAFLLADEDPGVRMRAACTIVMAVRGR
jgi:HEAT repeat protein